MTGAMFTFLNDKSGALWKVWKIERKKPNHLQFLFLMPVVTRFMHCLEPGCDCIAAGRDLLPAASEAV